jgi:sugar/nucleoside kinase (ribokinase family)
VAGGGVTIIGCVQADVLMAPVTNLPPPGGTLLADQAGIRVGGAGANAALSAVEAGMATRLIGCIGDDVLGQWMADELTPAGLADELLVLPGRQSGMTVALESAQRDRTFLTYLGVNADWVPEMIPGDALECDELLFCDYFVAPGLQGAAGQALLADARERGARTFFDTAYDPAGFPQRTRDEIRGLLPWVDVFLPNEAEACALAGIGPGDRNAAVVAARTLQAASSGWVVVKLGACGCLAAGPEGAVLSEAAPATAVVDTTGAGDTFNAGLVQALAGGASWPEALARATRFASELISRPSNERYRLARHHHFDSRA